MTTGYLILFVIIASGVYCAYKLHQFDREMEQHADEMEEQAKQSKR